jgi:hypothetical protein
MDQQPVEEDRARTVYASGSIKVALSDVPSAEATMGGLLAPDKEGRRFQLMLARNTLMDYSPRQRVVSTHGVHLEVLLS